MPFPIRTCAICHEEFELKPDKPGFASRCPSCSEPEQSEPEERRPFDPTERRIETEVNTARRRAIRDLLMRCLETHYGSLQGCVLVPGRAEELLRQVRELIESNGY